MIRVLLADDEELIRLALAALLDLEPDIEVVAHACDGRGAWTRRWPTAPTSPCSTWRCRRPAASRSPPS
ncbi:hypothetical protein [Micromonospora sp. b486]|uniref:hypothetical protein n=1 Tax=Micromonospora sp. b486 TaxID=3053986 RepID=UPI00259C6EC2|nr:hypothetical protein [Micromonospora sp. b486]MDM4777970.1 hypothetical protein [Micromonospora sp. b486]